MIPTSIGSIRSTRSENALRRRRFAGLLEWARRAGFVTSFLYFFKPPFPSDGGYAAVSAGRSGPVGPSRFSPGCDLISLLEVLTSVHMETEQLGRCVLGIS
jgi:hypothetical protein